jgi:integrase
MPTNKLTDHACRSAKPAEKDRKLFDGGGLFLFISTKGAKTWRMAYRLHSKPQTATFGEYPLVTLAEARAKRDGLKKSLAEGIEPQRKESKQPAFEDACRTYWGGRKDLSEQYRENALRGLELHLWPKLGRRPIGAIDREALLAELVALDAKGKHSYARKVRMWASQVFEWAREHRWAKVNPATDIRPRHAFGNAPVEHHPALDLPEIPHLWERLALEGDLQSVLACRLLAYTWVRTDELRYAEWSEFQGDLWRVPAARMKMDRDHIVPLPTQAMPILANLKARSRGSKYILPAEHRLDRAISENAVLALLYRLGYKGRMSGHGWRTVASTWANENGFNKDAIERQLAHAPDDKVRAAYNRAAFLPERRRMLQAFATWLNLDAGAAQGGKLPSEGALT